MACEDSQDRNRELRKHRKGFPPTSLCHCVHQIQENGKYEISKNQNQHEISIHKRDSYDVV